MTNQKIFRGVLKLFFELIIVFTGVSLAFLGSDYRAQKDADARALATLQVLHLELTNFAEYAPFSIQGMRAELTKFHESQSQGELPQPAYYREPRASSAPTAAWSATVESGAYTLLEPALFYELSLHYNRVISINQRFERYNGKVENHLLPKLYAKDNSQFYQDNAQLKGDYQLLVDEIKAIADELDNLVKDADDLRIKLNGQMQSF
ncbi:MAG: hypothetical protein AAFX87_07370 [Bacteroidota bacterium]